MNGDIAHKQPLLRRQSAIYAQAQAGKLLVLVENARVPIASGARKAIFARYGNTAYDGSGKSEMSAFFHRTAGAKSTNSNGEEVFVNKPTLRHARSHSGKAYRDYYAKCGMSTMRKLVCS
jgi:hypothetical protein